MTPAELAVIIDTAYRQWPHIEPDATIAEIWAAHLARHDAQPVARAVMEVLKTAKYPPTIADIVEQLGDGGTDHHADHVMQLLADGKFNTALNPADFPDARTYQAARSVSPQMRAAYSNQARTLYLQAWKHRKPDGTRPALSVVPNTDEKAIGA